MMRLKRYKEEERVATERWSETCRMNTDNGQVLALPE
jgi:hypothetical protein